LFEPTSDLKIFVRLVISRGIDEICCQVTGPLSRADRRSDPVAWRSILDTIVSAMMLIFNQVLPINKSTNYGGRSRSLNQAGALSFTSDFFTYRELKTPVRFGHRLTQVWMLRTNPLPE